MEEKVIKNKRKISIILVPTIILLVGAIISAVILQISYCVDGYVNHSHDEHCVLKNDTESDIVPFFSEEEYEKNPNEYSNFSDYIEAEYSKLTDEERDNLDIIDHITCDALYYGSAQKAFYLEILEDAFSIMFYSSGIICGLIFSLISLITIKKRCYEATITQSNIYGKKGFKKFDISYEDITNVENKGKKLILNTKNIRLKFSPVKNCNEIYIHIKSLMPEKPVTESTSTVDDIKLF